jgi:primosomal protein N' (replication factor Y)
MYASVIPAVKIPRAFGAFDYAVPPELVPAVRPGSLVVVGWRRRPVLGLVAAVSERPTVTGITIKPIQRLFLIDPLPADFVSLIERLAGRCFAAPGTVLHAFLPGFTKKQMERGLETAAAEPPGRRSPSRRRKAEVVVTASFAETAAALAAAARIAADRGLETLVIVPHLVDADRIAAALKEADPTLAPGIVTGGLGERGYRTAWLAAAAGETPLVIGTRPAVGLPLRRLGLVAVLEPDSRDHRQYDMNPRYDAREAAASRAEAAKADLLVIGQTPRTEERRACATGNLAWIDRRPDDAASPIIVGVGRLDRSRGPLSPTADRLIEDSLQAGNKVLIFHNRRGLSGALVCNDCGRPIRCPRCEIAYRLHGTGLVCHRCEETAATPDRCGGCGGFTLRPIGSGSAGLERHLKEKYAAASVVRLDSDQKYPADLATADILVGTQLLLHEIAEAPPGDRPLGAVIMSDADALLDHPGFRTTEEAWRTVRRLALLAARDGAEFAIETLDPEHLRWTEMRDAPAAFLDREIEARAAAGFPPCLDLVTVTVSAATDAEASAKASELRRRLMRLGPAGARLHGPIAPREAWRAGRWRRCLVIRGLDPTSRLAAEIARLPEEFNVEHDPDNLS